MTLVSVLVALLEPSQGLSATLGSLRRQDLTDWELVVALPPELAAPGRLKDARIRLVRTATDAGPDARAALLEAARSAASGRFLTVVEAGDQFEPGALAALLMVIDSDASLVAVYADEQWPTEGASGIARKPDFLPTLHEGLPYLGRPLLVLAEVAERVGGFASGTASVEEYDLHLRVSAEDPQIAHLPAIALTRAAAPHSSPAVDEAVADAVGRHLARTGRHGRVETTEVPGGVRTWLEPAQPAPAVTLVIPTAGGRREVRGEDSLLLTRCLRSLVELTTYPAWDVVIVASAHTPPDVLDEARQIVGDDRLQVVTVDGPFNFSASVNEGVRVARARFVLLLNDDTEVIEPRWLDRMMAVAADPRVGVVGAKLLFGDGTLQHVGVTVDDTLGPIHALGSEPDGLGPWGAKRLDTDWTAVTGACLLTPRALYAEVGGFSEGLPLNFNDLDYCFKVGERGLRVVCTPFAALWHYESSSRGHHLEQWEVDRLRRTWYLRLRTDPHVEYRSSW